MMKRKVAILQSNYIPWKGYFDLINSVDDFVLFDDVQYTRRDWRNRNKVKTANGLRWLTIPVEVKGKYFQAIKETRIADNSWAADHWQTIVHCYSRAPHFGEFKPLLQDLYKQAAEIELLSQVNFLFIRNFCELLGIKTRLHWSSDFQLADEKSERLLSICQQLDASEYVSGPAAKSYLQTDLFDARGVAVSWFSYDRYPEYEQLYPPFDHNVSLIDLIVHAGKEAPRFMNSFCPAGVESR